jgi:hypothetical protein
MRYTTIRINEQQQRPPQSRGAECEPMSVGDYPMVPMYDMHAYTLSLQLRPDSDVVYRLDQALYP